MRQWKKAQQKSKRIAELQSGPSRHAWADRDAEKAVRARVDRNINKACALGRGRTIAELQEQSVRLRNVPITLPRISILETAD